MVFVHFFPKSTKRPNQNFTASVLQQKVFKRSSKGVLFLNKESLNFAEKTSNGLTDFNRNLGIEYNLASANNPWTRKAVSGEASKVVKTHFFLVSPKIEVTFSNKLFWTTFVQYNEQRQNTNINSRAQWRYKPASDIFLVYTDNYFPNSYEIKN